MVAVAINAAVAIIAFVIARFTPRAVINDDADAKPVLQSPDAKLVYLAIGLSGLTALGAEVAAMIVDTPETQAIANQNV